MSSTPKHGEGAAHVGDPDSLAHRIKQARLRSSMTQREVAVRLGLSPGAVGQWELGLSAPSSGKLGSLARELDVEVDWLLMAPGQPSGGEGTLAGISDENLLLLREALALGVDMQQVVHDDARQQNWLHDNRGGLADANAFLERSGLWSDGRRLF